MLGSESNNGQQVSLNPAILSLNACKSSRDAHIGSGNRATAEQALEKSGLNHLALLLPSGGGRADITRDYDSHNPQP